MDKCTHNHSDNQSSKHHSHCKECCHEQHHNHNHAESPRHRLITITVSAVLLAVAVVIERTCSLATWQLLLVFLVPYLVAGFETLKEAAEGIVHGNLFNEHFLMSIATLGALSIGFMPGADTQFAEAVFVMLFFQVGELFEGFAERRSRASIAHLMDIRPDTATVLHDGHETVVSPETVAVGDIILLRPGDRVPLDAVVTEGCSTLDTKALTGESVPRNVAVGDELVSGCINLSGVVYARVTKPFAESTVSRIIALVEDAGANKSRSETFITRFARVYTPVVVIAAFLLAIVPPLVVATDFSNFSFQGPVFTAQFPVWLYRALLFLVVSCPCALVISVPLSFFGGIGGASRCGILVKGANFMDVLARTETVVFDKTGTLTEGRFAVEAVHPDRLDERQLLHLAAHVERYSTHPIATALRDAFPDEPTDGCSVVDTEETAGHGVCARVGEKTVCVGNDKMLRSMGIEAKECHLTGTIIHVVVDGEYAGHIVINDKLKDDSRMAVDTLRSLGVKRTVMLTGDSEAVAADVASRLGLDDHYAHLLPTDKVEWIEKLKSTGSTVAFVGDGINDAPVLARADVGIAMGGLGSDAAIEAADVVLMDDKPSQVATAIRISRRTIRIARQNVVFAIAVKIAVLLFATLGLATMWMAVFADVGVTVLAVANATRTLKAKY